MNNLLGRSEYDATDAQPQPTQTACQYQRFIELLGKSAPPWVASAGCDHEVPVV